MSKVKINYAKEDLAEMMRRMQDWRRPAPRYPAGVFAKYAALVSSASEGAITRPPATLATH